MDLRKHLTEIVPFRLGSRVTVNPTAKYSSDWPGVYVVTGMHWDYQRGRVVNIEIASDDDIQHRYGPTDGWSVEDLAPA